MKTDMTINQRPAYRWALKALSENPFSDARSLARVAGRPQSQVYTALKDLVDAGLAGRVLHETVHQSRLYRHYLTTGGLAAARAALGMGMSDYCRSYPISDQWLRLLIGRMDAVAGIHALAAALSPGADELSTTITFHRKGALDATITRYDGRSFGVVRQGRALRRRSLYIRLMRLWRYEHDTSALLVITPTPWEASIVANWGASRGYSDAFVVAESEVALTSRDRRVWLRVSSVIGDVCTLSEVIAESRAYDKSPAGSPSRRRATLPDPDALIAAAATFGLRRKEKEALDIITAHSMIRRQDLVRSLGVSESRLGQLMRRLEDRWGLVERHGRRGERRYTLSLAGIRYITARDRAELQTTRRAWSAAPLAIPHGGRRYEGHLIDAWARRTAHADGITWWRSQLEAETEDDPASALLWWTPESWTHRPFHWREYTISPDAVGELVARGHRLYFFLEYERRARYHRGITRRLRPYQAYYTSFDTGGDLPAWPLCLFVVDEEAVADRYVQTACEDKLLWLPILVSSRPELEGAGILGRSWRPLWEPDAPQLTLAEAARYSWNYRQWRMERRA